MADENDTLPVEQPSDSPSPKRLGRPPGSGKKFGEFTIELGNKYSRQVLFLPLGQVFRGRWDENSLRGQTAANCPDLSAMPTIPGIHLTLDPAGKVGKVFDPLNLPENSSLLAEVQRHYAGITKTQGCPMEDKKFDLGRDRVKTWAYWMVRLLTSGDAFLRAGVAPEATEVRALEGSIDIGSPDGVAYNRKSLEEFERSIR